MQIRTTKLKIMDGLELKEASFRKQVFPDHFHDAYSIGIIEQGIEKLDIADKKGILAHANTVIVINPYEIHANSYYDHDPWAYRIVYISLEAMQYAQRQMGLFPNNTLSFPHMGIDDAELYRLILDFHMDTGQLYLTKLQAMLGHLIRHYAAIKPESDNSQYHQNIGEAAHFIRQHCGDKIAIDELAARYAMDKYKFIRSFKQQTGLTPVSYLLLHRINHSKALIAQDMPILDVALESGFYDQSHYTHYFKKYIGISPLTYKKGIYTES